MVARPNGPDRSNIRNLVIVLGDQLDSDSAAFDGFDPVCDAVAQMEVLEEATYVRQHKKKIAYFFSAMRHFRAELETKGRRVHYVEVEDPHNTGTLEGEIGRLQLQLKPSRTIVLEPGDWRALDKLRRLRHPPEIRTDRHFLCSTEQFDAFASALFKSALAISTATAKSFGSSSISKSSWATFELSLTCNLET